METTGFHCYQKECYEVAAQCCSVLPVLTDKKRPNHVFYQGSCHISISPFSSHHYMALERCGKLLNQSTNTFDKVQRNLNSIVWFTHLPNKCKIHRLIL